MLAQPVRTTIDSAQPGRGHGLPPRELTGERLAALHAELEDLRDFRIEQLAELERTGHLATLDGATREVHSVLESGARSALHDVQVALWQLEEGSYGWCELCGDPLDIEQLKSVPQALRCARCHRARRPD